MNKVKSFFSKAFRNDGVQSVITSLICIAVGLLVGFIVLLIINPSGALNGIKTIILNFFNYSTTKWQIRYLGMTLTKTVPLICTALSILFAYKAGLFNIGAAGQYVVAIGTTFICAFDLKMPWFLTIICAALVSGFYGAIVGILKSFLNVNEVISAIMLNWIGLFCTNMIIKSSSCWDSVKYETSTNFGSLQRIPTLGLDKLFNFDNMSISLFIVIFIAVIVLVVLSKTTFGYELKASGFNRNAAKYAGINDKKSTILTMGISGALAGIGAPLYYLTAIEAYKCPASVPAMGFNGISSAFLGGLNPIGSIFSSYFLTHISEAGSCLDTTKYCAQTSDLIAGVIIYLCAFSGFFKYLFKKSIEKREKKKNEKIATEVK